MPAVARGSGQDTISTGHTCTSTTNTDKCSTNVFVNNKGACRKGDKIKVHTHKVGKKCVNHTETIKEGSASVFVNNIAIARKSDSADKGSISSGSPTVFAGSNSYPMTGKAILVNAPPVAVASSVSMTKLSVKKFSTSDFKFEDEEKNSIKSVVITSLPKSGTFKLGNTTVKPNQVIPADKISLLSYTPNKSARGTQYVAVGFKIQDTGGTANKGKDTGIGSNITITVTPK